MPAKSKHVTKCGNLKCQVTDTPLWRKGWKRTESCPGKGSHVMLCNSCGLHYKKGHFCNHCMQIYREKDCDDETKPWVSCERCHRWVHIECERAANPKFEEQVIQNKLNSAAPFFCNSCLELKHQLNNDEQLFAKTFSDVKKRRKRPLVAQVAKKVNLLNAREDHSPVSSGGNSPRQTSSPQQQQFYYNSTSENMDSTSSPLSFTRVETPTSPGSSGGASGGSGTQELPSLATLFTALSFTNISPLSTSPSTSASPMSTGSPVPRQQKRKLAANVIAVPAKQPTTRSMSLLKEALLSSASSSSGPNSSQQQRAFAAASQQQGVWSTSNSSNASSSSPFEHSPITTTTATTTKTTGSHIGATTLDTYSSYPYQQQHHYHQHGSAEPLLAEQEDNLLPPMCNNDMIVDEQVPSVSILQQQLSSSPVPTAAPLPLQIRVPVAATGAAAANTIARPASPLKLKTQNLRKQAASASSSPYPVSPKYSSRLSPVVEVTREKVKEVYDRAWSPVVANKMPATGNASQGNAKFGSLWAVCAAEREHIQQQ